MKIQGSSPWTRRTFLLQAGGLALARGNLPVPLGRENSGGDAAPKNAGPATGRYRAVSWWLTFDDLTWPNRELIHALPARVQTLLHPHLKHQMSQQAIIERLQFAPLRGELRVRPVVAAERFVLHSPDLSSPRVARRSQNGAWAVELLGISRYFIVECVG